MSRPQDRSELIEGEYSIHRRKAYTEAGKRSTLAFVSVEPENVLGYSVVYTSCDSQFQALTLPKVECTPKSSGLKTASGTFGRQSLLYLSLLLLGSLVSLL